MHYISESQTQSIIIRTLPALKIYTYNSVKERTGISVVGDSGPF